MAQVSKSKIKKTAKKDTTTSKKDSVSKDEDAYKKITGKDSAVEKGLFNVYQNKEDYYFEIPTRLLHRDMLVVNKLERVPMELNEAGVNRGVNYQNQLIRFELDKKAGKLLIRQERPLPVSPEKDAITGSVQDNFISPLIAGFKIEAYSPDSTSVFVKVNEIYNGNKTSINNVFDNINLGTSADSNLSRILSIRSFKNNIAARSELTTTVHEGMTKVNVTVEVVSSIVLLPEKPMIGRYDNQKVGYFTSDRLSFSDSQQRVSRKKLITRWRLEPKAGEEQKYLAGELVEPAKPIVFYIDKATPNKWKPYIKKGIESWNMAFEKAGFKHAVQARFALDSLTDKDNDADISQIIYAASEKSNAMGPSILDPRSGEIIEADIMWWHNVLAMLQEWITVQTGPINPAARKAVIPDSIMGEAIQFVLCHEVGHSLGLRHNMIASWAYPTDSLRSKTFTDRVNSTSASIMDYARFNYVAQPGDGVTKLCPQLGEYDMFAIEYGYRWYGKKNPDEEKTILHNYLTAHNKRVYKYSEAQDPRDAVDPRAQMEDLGDNPVKSSRYGIANLKIVINNVIKWTTTGEQGQTYEEASRLYYGVVNQWNNYLYHAMANIGGIYIENTVVGDKVPTYTFVEKHKQKESLRFLLDEIFTYPEWLFSPEIAKYTYFQKNTPNGMVENSPSKIYKNAQGFIFWDLLSDNRMMRMLENEAENGKHKAFTLEDMMDMLHKHIFAKTIRGRSLNVADRYTQKGFVDALITAAAYSEGVKINKKLVYDKDVEAILFRKPACCEFHASHHNNGDRMAEKRTLSFYGSQINRISDAISVKRGELLRIKNLINNRIKSGDLATYYHYRDLLLRIDTALGIQ
ncbi:zinc-dependent metalloprotease [Porphyromonas pogonae]|uniref:zinc-dependent metalloprotease n=1 Tax=Porphyromonas pogonae TaxID=867595 RepID=UPI002E781A5D|nr:zinc-dependent metalloprotease [Porphyromonas pogonae]